MTELTNEKQMTIKEVAEFFGKSEPTIRRVAKKIGIKFNNGKRKTYSKIDLENMSKELYRKVPLAVKESINYTFSNDQGKPLSNDKVGNTLSQKDIDMIGTIVSMTVAKTIEALDGRVERIESKFEERKALLPAPQKTDRQNLNQLIRSYCKENDIMHGIAWSMLYEEAYYILNINIKTRAENRGITAIDYADEEELIPELLSIAMDIFK